MCEKHYSRALATRGASQIHCCSEFCKRHVIGAQVLGVHLYMLSGGVTSRNTRRPSERGRDAPAAALIRTYDEHVHLLSEQVHLLDTVQFRVLD
jgi:hypothetical protein